MDLLKQIVARAQSDKQRIVLPEAEEERTLKAADRALQDGLADIILIGNPENIRKEAEEWGLKNIDKATIVDPKNNPRCEEYAEKLAELRKKKGMTEEEAVKRGYSLQVSRLPAAAIPRARTLQQIDGMMKAIVNAHTGRIIGCTLFCIDAPEVINLVSLAMKNDLHYSILRDFIFTHPSMSEGLNDLFKAF